MAHLLYSLDFAPPDYLFCFLQNHLKGKTFDSDKSTKHKFIQILALKNQTLFESKIMPLAGR